MNTNKTDNARQVAREYKYSVTYNEDDDLYVATVEEWPQISGHGPTHETAIEDAHKAVAIAIQDRRAEKQIYPQPSVQQSS